jgi:Domain of unknown function (DUF4041)/Meiotically up-regulated gene 113
MMVLLLSIIVAVSAIAIVLLALYVRCLLTLKHFRQIRDVEQYRAECEQKSQAALAECARLGDESKSLEARILEHKTKVRQYQALLGNLRSATELQERIRSDKIKVQQLAATLGKLERASQLDDYLLNQDAAIRRKEKSLQEFDSILGGARTISEIAAKVKYHENLLAQLKADIEAVEEVGELQEFGFYRPRFAFDTSDEYKKRLAAVRTKQKGMLKRKVACVCHTEWTVDGDKREGKKMLNQQVKLMLRAFNGECDAAVSNVKYNNVKSLESRVTRSFEAINKLGESHRVNLAPEFYQLKFDELHLAHEYQEKKQEEKEEQQRIREQMKEELKVTKEIEKAQDDATRDEQLRRDALEKAREELARKAGEQTTKLEALVSKLENELQEALDRKAKAIARAQLTRSGHVYILSNIGTFGENVYKIGLTRRLEPLERVNELGGASVPFPFDVHAMVYSEDAPALENTLHHHFGSRRVNLVNLRREFFNVTLDEIRAAVAQHFGHVTFVTVPQAVQYRKTLAMRKEGETESAPLQIA